jgi:Ca2+-binding EF-hand superfamily protein
MKTNLHSRNDLTKTHLTLTLALSVLSCYLMASCALNKNLQPATVIPGVGGGGFELADANHDGKLSRAEASDFLAGEIFNARDTNHDGQITKAEWTAADRKDTAGFAKRDANHDGVMTREEAVKYSRNHGLTKKAFAEADKNHDGFLDRAEVEAYYSSREGNPASH